MNKSIFKNPVELMENIVGVTEFFKKQKFQLTVEIQRGRH